MVDLIERELELNATPEEAWRALTDPTWLSAWLADEVRLDLEPGGEACFRLGDEERHGWVEEVAPPGESGDAPARLSFWWTREGEPASRVELELVEICDGRVRLRVAETRPLEALDLVGTSLPGQPMRGHGPVLVAA